VKTPREVVQDWVTAYNRRDAHAAAELYHEDATNLQVALCEPTIGRQAMLDDLLSFLHAFPDSRSFTLRGCGFFHVTDGKIRFQREYFDKATWFGQLGIPLT
jgi:ketosteroid isomerase-like protein